VYGVGVFEGYCEDGSRVRAIGVGVGVWRRGRRRRVGRSYSKNAANTDGEVRRSSVVRPILIGNGSNDSS